VGVLHYLGYYQPSLSNQVQKSTELLETFHGLGYLSCEEEQRGDVLVCHYAITPRGRDLVSKLQSH
jgi:hypothetical protein